MWLWHLFFLFFISIFSFAQGPDLELFPDEKAPCEELLASSALKKHIAREVQWIFGQNGQYEYRAVVEMGRLLRTLPHVNLNFAIFERIFREQNVPIYLLATPGPAPEGNTIQIHPANRDRQTIPAPYYLTLGIENPEEVAAYLQELGVKAETNLERLETTGVLVDVLSESEDDPGF